MPALHIRDVDDAVLAALKAQAERNHRSLQGEVRSILEQAVAAAAPKLALKTVHVGGSATFSRDDMYDDQG
jgi:plasmid stability protein